MSGGIGGVGAAQSFDLPLEGEVDLAAPPSAEATIDRTQSCPFGKRA